MQKINLTRISPIRSLRGMLAATTPAPNTHSPKTRTKPLNWRGVSEGMAAATAAVRNGKFEQAELILEDVLEFAPAELRAWRLLARIQRRLGKIDAGILSATRALQLQTLNQSYEPAASITLARLLFEQKEYGEALKMLDNLMAHSPDNHELSLLREQWHNQRSA
ncbi:MAG: tetratricopeptide repeat protein [Mariprofundus sp.]|nr:tetratricopeptide repeat protein [Mariprofundus sp.]